MDVYRGPHKIASASGPAVDTPEGPGLEVNHGPDGVAVRGDCWEGATPDILPGDRIVVTGDGGTDEIFVDDIVIDQRSHRRYLNAGYPRTSSSKAAPPLPMGRPSPSVSSRTS